jgi:hypothetical protein
MNPKINKAFKQAENYVKEVSNELHRLQMQLILSQNSIEATLKNTGNLELL